MFHKNPLQQLNLSKSLKFSQNLFLFVCFYIFLSDIMEEDLRKSKINNLKKIEAKNIDPFPYKFSRTHLNTELIKKFAKIKAGAKPKTKPVKIAGRIMGLRRFGSLSFADLVDGSAKLQICLRKDETKKDSFELFGLVDVGDFVGVEGQIFKTKKGELSVLVKTLTILAKSIAPLPEKWHGLRDVEIRHRKRHLDLIMNAEVKKIFEKKAKIYALTREFCDSKGFLEVETPLLQPVYGGANARPFITKSYAWKSNFYLSISPELYLKRLIIGGYERVYTISRNFRNESVDRTHNPEFSMLELYAAYWDYNDVMNFVEDLFEFISKKLNNSTKIVFGKQKIDFKKPWKRITMYD